MGEGRIDCLIFSKDRPAQLDLLLRSIDRHALGLYQTLTVLVASSSTEYKKGYQQLRNDPAWTMLAVSRAWYPEVDFKSDFRDWFERTDNRRTGEVISFLVDDDVFYRDATDPEELPWSYRGGDYDYPFSVDGNVYAKADIVKLLAGLHFRNPTELEAFGHTHRKRLPFTEVNHGKPCLVGIPANRVSVSSGMPHMGIDPAELNRRYLAGERLALPREAWPTLSFWDKEVQPLILGAHENLPLVFG